MEKLKLDLLVVISGKTNKILESNKLLKQNLLINLIDEKDLAKPKMIFQIIKLNDFENLYFGTEDIGFQRFQFLIFLYFLLTFNFKGKLIDENGSYREFNFIKFVFYQIPLFLLELIVSSYYVIFYSIKTSYLLWKNLKRN
ncbi:MAG: hypothetical protein NTW25_15780 [Candidatus Kapabacteria bacterium]|nr:hypothetical protein [Candidatus Kapabacteria bacterium]